MKLYIKEKVFSWYDQFSVTNNWGEERYYVEGELFSFGKAALFFESFSCRKKEFDFRQR